MSRINTNPRWSGDMSTDRSTEWSIRPRGATRACVQTSWPVTDTPVGVFAIETDNACANGVAGFAYSTTPLSPQPAGTAGSNQVEIETAAHGVRLTYTRTSGGTGAEPTTTIVWS